MEHRTSNILSVVVLICGALLALGIVIYRPEMRADADLGSSKTGDNSPDDHYIADQGKSVPKLADPAIDQAKTNNHDEAKDEKAEQLKINRTIAQANADMATFTKWLVLVSIAAAIIQSIAIAFAIREVDPNCWTVFGLE